MLGKYRAELKLQSRFSQLVLRRDIWEVLSAASQLLAMASGLILWVSCMTLLLGARVALSVDDWRFTADKQNLDPEDSNSIVYDEGELANKLAGLLPPNYIQPSVKQPPSLIPAGQSPANAENGNGIEQIVNGAAREWDSNLFEPITFPLQQKKTTQPQSTPIYTNPKLVSPSLVEGSFENKNFVPKPAEPSPYVAALPPSFQPLQPASPVAAGSPFGSLNQQTASSPGADLRKSVFGKPSDNSEDPLTSGLNVLGFSSTPTKSAPKLEQVSNKYPSVAKPQRPSAFNTDWFGQGNDVTDGSADYGFPFWKPSFQGPVGLPYYRDWMGFPFPGFGEDNLYYGQMALKPQNFGRNTGKYWVPQMSYAQRSTKPATPRKNFVVHSKSGYQRRRFLQSKTTYVPGFEMPQKRTPDYETPRKYHKSPTLSRGPAQNLIRRPVQDSISPRKL